MAKMTKAQKKRMVADIRKKTQKLFSLDIYGGMAMPYIVSTADMDAIDKMCAKWIKRIG